MTRFEIPTPPTTDPVSFALSADGRQLAFVAMSEGASRLWVRPLDQVTARPLAGTEGASYPFWKPDGRAIGFFADGKLKRIDLGSDVPQILADAPNGRGGTWNRDDVVVFAPDGGGGLMRVMARHEWNAGASDARWRRAGEAIASRSFCPMDGIFCFSAAAGRRAGMYRATLDGGEPTRVLDSRHGSRLCAARSAAVGGERRSGRAALRRARGVVSGEPVAVAQAVGLNEGSYRGAFAVSQPACLAHRASPRRTASTHLDRSRRRHARHRRRARRERAWQSRHWRPMASALRFTAPWQVNTGRMADRRRGRVEPVYVQPEP